LKVLIASDIKTFKNRFYPTVITMEDKLRKNSKTEMKVTAIEFDIQIPEGTFSERNLQKK